MPPGPAVEKGATASPNPKRPPQAQTQAGSTAAASPQQKATEKGDKQTPDKTSDTSKGKPPIVKKMSLGLPKDQNQPAKVDDSDLQIAEPVIPEPYTDDLHYIPEVAECYMCSEGDAMISSYALWGWDTQGVVVKRPRPLSPVDPSKLHRPPRFQLNYEKEQPELKVYSAETSMLKARVQALEQRVQGGCDKMTRILQGRGLHGQEAALRKWEQTKVEQDEVSGRVARKTHYPRQLLMLNKPLPLPPIENHKGHSYGPSSDFPQPTQKERSPLNEAFFLVPDRFGGELDGICASLEWRQRQLYKPPFTIIRPPIPYESCTQDGIDHVTVCGPSRSGNLTSVKSRTRRLAEYKALTSLSDNPLLELAVMGNKMEVHQSPELPEQQDIFCESNQPNPEKSWSISSINSMKVAYHQEISCGPRLDSPYFVRNVVPAFKIDRFTYIWKQPCLRGKVEIGVVCNAGERGWTKIRLANVGCCTMRYSWRHHPHHDYFNTGRYRKSAFIFNTAPGILLPEEKISMPVVFISDYAGAWTDRWFLQTTPNVGPGNHGEIPLTLFGHALETDWSQDLRQRLEDRLHHSAIVRRCERDVWDLVKFLPIRERKILLMEKIPPIPDSRGADDVEMFLKKNPGLYYQSAPMILLLACYVAIYPNASRHDVLRTSKTKTDGSPSDDPNPSQPSDASRRASVANVSDAVSLSKVNNKKSRSSPTGSTTVPPTATLPIPPTATLPIPPPAPKGGKKNMRPSRQYSGNTISVKGDMSSDQIMAGSFHATDNVDLEDSDFCIWEPNKCVDDFGLARASLDVCALYQQTKSLEESERKEEVLRVINESILTMRLKTFAPPMRQYKHVVMRSALAQLFDEIARSEYKIRLKLRLLDDERFTQNACFLTDLLDPIPVVPEVVPQPEVVPKKEKVKGTKPATAVLQPQAQAQPQPQEIKTPLPSPSDVSCNEEPLKPLWELPKAKGYLEKLYLHIYSQLSECLVSLLPVLTYDGYTLSPILRKLKVEENSG